MFCKISFDKLAGKMGPLEPAAPLSLVCLPALAGMAFWLMGLYRRWGHMGPRVPGWPGVPAPRFHEDKLRGNDDPHSEPESEVERPAPALPPSLACVSAGPAVVNREPCLVVANCWFLAVPPLAGASSLHGRRPPHGCGMADKSRRGCPMLAMLAAQVLLTGYGIVKGWV